MVPVWGFRLLKYREVSRTSMKFLPHVCRKSACILLFWNNIGKLGLDQTFVLFQQVIVQVNLSVMSSFPNSLYLLIARYEWIENRGSLNGFIALLVSNQLLLNCLMKIQFLCLFYSLLQLCPTVQSIQLPYKSLSSYPCKQHKMIFSQQLRLLPAWSNLDTAAGFDHQLWSRHS